MKSVDYLIIGGSAAGTTAAEVVRSLVPEASITIITDEPYEEYSRVLLPFYIRKQSTREQLFLKKPQWYQEKKIELVKNTKAQDLEPKSHRVKVSSGEVYQYGKLLIAIGGFPVELSVDGSELENILYFRTVDDADEILKVAAEAKKAVIIGGGFVSLDFATGFYANGISDITILVREPYYWAGKLDDVSSQVLTNVLLENGVKIITGDEIEKFEPSFGEASEGKVGAVLTRGGKTLECDVAAVGIGIRPDILWLSGSAVKINRWILTNEYLETNLPDVYAAGDCAEFFDVIFNKQHALGNWANATSQGSVAAKNMVCAATGGKVGARTIFETASSYSDSFFGKSYTFIGVTDAKYADEVISRGSVESGKMTRIFVKTIDNVLRIVGATVINDPAEVGPLTSAVKGKTDIFPHIDKLGDLNFDLKKLLET
ncbi:FAD-dependent oxidoreductase [Candidatus Curtissbacteria bacterium]|nr:FAD-dependent oxidoreductase [Candidatus Curtissbacteria bacterium]